ncbi:MAG: HAMP domain-containing sensor histidine kinase [Acutalibacteraceae bacterium]|nr:HAMP domain-containing sensor histidine kinase [Acutalibacteraceae bacterium]
MIKKLRRKFIAVAMCCIIVVLGAIISIINTANYISINQQADERLNMIAENGGVFPKNDFKIDKHIPHDISPETPFEVRYFTVKLHSDGTIIYINTGRIAAVSTSTAAEYAEQLFDNEQENGFIGDYKYTCVNIADDIMYIFLDCGRELSTFYSFLFASVAVSIAGIVLVFVLVLIFSKIALKPVAESYEKQKRFITDAGHEIKTPLTIIDANTEVLEMINGESEWSESIKNQVKRLSSLTEKLVLLSKMDEEETIFQMSEFSLSDVVANTAQSFIAVAESKGKIFEVNIQESINYCGNETLICQLVSILLDNAMKYSNENGKVEISLKSNGKNKILTVYNTVESIQTGKLNFLFERFYRTDTSRNSETGGHGIGLSVAKAIVNTHKGKITAFSSDGKNISVTTVL